MTTRWRITESWATITPDILIEVSQKLIAEGYHGASQLIQEMCNEFYWPIMETDLVNNVKHCRTCVKEKGPRIKRQNVLYLFLPRWPGRIFEMQFDSQSISNKRDLNELIADFLEGFFLMWQLNLNRMGFNIALMARIITINFYAYMKSNSSSDMHVWRHFFILYMI